MDEATIKQFCEAIGGYCWRNDFVQFATLTGFQDSHAIDRWRALQQLNEALSSFDYATLTKIVNAPKDIK